MTNVVSIDSKRHDRIVESARAALPSEDTVRWVAHRKAAVVRAIECGAISREEALRRYGLSDEELETWCDSLATHGLAALRATRVQHYRNTYSE